MVENFIDHYNKVRLHSAIGYIAPVDKLNGREQEIFKERALRKKKRFRANSHNPIMPGVGNLLLASP